VCVGGGLRRRRCEGQQRAFFAFLTASCSHARQEPPGHAARAAHLAEVANERQHGPVCLRGALLVAGPGQCGGVWTRRTSVGSSLGAHSMMSRPVSPYERAMPRKASGRSALMGGGCVRMHHAQARAQACEARAQPCEARAAGRKRALAGHRTTHAFGQPQVDLGRRPVDDGLGVQPRLLCLEHPGPPRTPWYGCQSKRAAVRYP
jgi:hypothetical protein